MDHVRVTCFGRPGIDRSKHYGEVHHLSPIHLINLSPFQNQVMGTQKGNQDLASLAIAANFRRVKGTRLYRSSKLDNVDEKGLDGLKKLDISTVLDLRSPEGWEDTATQGQLCLMDSHYEAISVTYSSWTRNISNTMTRSSRKETVFNYKTLEGRTPTEGVLGNSNNRRLFLNLVDKEFALGVLRDVIPWYMKPWIVILMISFLICRTRLFLREFARLGMNRLGIVGQYQSIVQYCGQSINASLSLLSEPSNVPTVICCAQGKDRTGVISALVMAVCGASREEIIKEYAASQEHLKDLSEAMQRYTDSYYLKPEFGTANASTMESLLDFIDEKYGSIPNYLELIGFSREQQEQLKQNIIER